MSVAINLYAFCQVPGTIRALPATIRAANGQIHSILWGLPERSRQKETLMVGHSLKHQSAVDVSVVGVRVTEEHVYEGTLITIFPGHHIFDLPNKNQRTKVF